MHRLRAIDDRGRTSVSHLIIAATRAARKARSVGRQGVEAVAKNFVMTTLARASRGEKTHVPIDQWGTPTWSNALAAAVHQHVAVETRGILHLSGADCLDRFAFARLIATVFGFDVGLIEGRPTAELNQRAGRPLHGGLTSRRSDSLGSARHGLERMRDALGPRWAAHA